MASLSQQWLLAENPAFQQRVWMAAFNQIAAVNAEVGTTNNHTNRAAFAALVSIEASRWVPHLSHGILTNGVNANLQTAMSTQSSDTNNLNAADADIVAAMATVWDFFSNAAASATAAARVI